ncbi:protein sneaky [Scaptodrosophila lebanonensis]|uniref:Protein sneaky n=1 Tax=Drosophila lebanonensis TaxID=7225 RepID=A0A6J2T2P6_DROLE|nr:protein sneaky [Scaptodrosophila lebanonensis]
MFHFLTKFTRTLLARSGSGRQIYCLLYGRDNDDNQIKVVRYVCSFLLGLFLAYLLWELVALNFNLTRFFANVPIFGVFIVLNGLAFAVSRNVRSITLLIFVALVGKSGRSYLRAIAFAFVISGPIDNLSTNAGEAARVFACTTVLTYNLTKTRFDLMAKPFTNTLQHMKGDIAEIQMTFKELEDILADLEYGVEHANIEDDKFGANDTLALFRDYRERRGTNTTKSEVPTAADIQEKFVRNMRNRCKHQLRSGHRVCQELFKQGYRKCTTNFPDFVATAICWPYRVDIICKLNIFGNPDKVCDASQVVPKDFGQTYVDMVQTERELYDNSSDIEITYNMQNSTAQEHLRTAQQSSDEFTEDFNRRKRIFDAIMLIIEKVLCLFLFRVICASIRYFLLYRSNIDFDNFYITDYFKHVDGRRKDLGKRSILPLRSYEKSHFVDVDNLCSRTSEESSTVVYHLLQLSLEIITAGLFVLLDRVVVNLLGIIHRRSLINYHQEGEHEVRFHINGTGIMARLLRTTMKNFNIHERVSTSLSNKECLPVAHVLPSSFYTRLLLLYLAIILLIYQSTTFLRLRRVICSYFYYKREKQRILFLYNRMLRERHSNFEIIRKKAEQNLATQRVQDNFNICLRLRLRYPELFGCLYAFKCAKRKCLICEALEDHIFVVCPNCGLPYCHECSLELNSTCISCEHTMKSESVYSKAKESGSSSDVYSYRKDK